MVRQLTHDLLQFSQFTTRPMTATLSTRDLRLSLISWKSELLSLSCKFPEVYDATSVLRRLDELDAALLAIDGSTTVTLSAA